MKRMKRQHRLDAGMRGWIVNTAKRNLWRVHPLCDIEDLIQEGFICYCNCNVKYGEGLDQRHFMSLVQTTFLRHIHDLAAEKSKKNEVMYAQDNPIFDIPIPEEATFLTMLKQLPRELQELVSILVNDAKEIPMIVRDDRTRETTNEYLCRLVGLDPEFVKIADVFKEHFVKRA